jgi:trigger factor
MKPTVENVSKLERKMSFQIPPEDVAKAFEKTYLEIQKNVEIKGFRKGKVPMTKVKELYGDRAQSDVIQSLVEESFFKALDEANLDPINQPQLDMKPLEEGKPFNFSLTFEVHPEVELKKYEGLDVQKEKLDLDHSHVDKTLENIRKNQAQTVPVLEDRSAKKGDIAVIDFEGFVDGAPLEGGKGENHPLELGSNSFIEGFEEAIEGMKVGGSQTIKLKFPETYHVPAIAGKPVEFKVSLKELKKQELPEMNTEFLEKVGFKTLEDLKDAILKDYTATEEKRIKEDFKNRLLKELTLANPMEVPKTLLERQKEVLKQDMHQRMGQMGMNEEQFKEYVSKWDKDFTDTATFIVQSSYIVNKIAEKEKLNATPEDVNQKIQTYIVQTGIEEARINEIYNKPENRKRLMNSITEEKVIDFLTAKAKVSEVPKDKLKDTK